MRGIVQDAQKKKDGGRSTEGSSERRITSSRRDSINLPFDDGIRPSNDRSNPHLEKGRIGPSGLLRPGESLREGTQKQPIRPNRERGGVGRAKPNAWVHSRTKWSARQERHRTTGLPLFDRIKDRADIVSEHHNLDKFDWILASSLSPRPYRRFIKGLCYFFFPQRKSNGKRRRTTAELVRPKMLTIRTVLLRGRPRTAAAVFGNPACSSQDVEMPCCCPDSKRYFTSVRLRSILTPPSGRRGFGVVSNPSAVLPISAMTSSLSSIPHQAD